MNVVSMQGSGPASRGPRLGAGIVAALDVGSHKICCLIARKAATRNRLFGDSDFGALEIVGAGQHESAGIRNGAVVDMVKAERAIRGAVDAAERQANVTLEQVYVNVSGGQPGSRRFSAGIDLGGREVTERDMRRVLLLARRKVDTGRRAVLHAAPLGYSLDGHAGVMDPQGMFADTLGAELSIVSVLPGPMRNLAHCVRRCHLRVAGFVLAPFASGLSALVRDERDLGVALIDMGAGATSVSVFYEGHLVYADVLGIGGSAVTNDIARGLSTPVAHAERIKTLYGSALASVADDRELIAVPLVGEKGRDSVNKIPRSMLTGIIQPRLEEIFELVRDRLKQSGYAALAGRRVVLTGGTSQLVGIRELAASILDRKVRLGGPQGLKNLPDFAQTPAFASTCGLLVYSLDPDSYTAVRPPIDDDDDEDRGYLTRVGRWLKQSF